MDDMTFPFHTSPFDFPGHAFDCCKSLTQGSYRIRFAPERTRFHLKTKSSSQSISIMANRLLLYFLPLQWALNSRVHLLAAAQLSALDHLVAKGLQEGKDIQDDESLINLSMILTNMAKTPESVLTHLDLYLTSLLSHSTKNSRFRLLIISDASLAPLLRSHLNM